MEREYTANITLHELEDRRAFLNSKGISYRIFNSFKDGELFVENNNQDLVIAEFETEAEMDIFLKNQKHIFLYADEFTSDIWSGYCEILSLPVATLEIKIKVASAEALN